MEILARPLKPIPGLADLKWMARDVPLVEMLHCTMIQPCGRCHFCRVAKDGPEYWLKGKP